MLAERKLTKALSDSKKNVILISFIDVKIIKVNSYQYQLEKEPGLVSPV